MKTLTLLAALLSAAHAAPNLRVEPLESSAALAGADVDLDALRAAVAAKPGDRTARFELIAGLRAKGEVAAALDAARAWREKDAYNLVVVRLIGDLLSELGRDDEARRAYSAVVELLPEDAAAHRALATVLKQAGDLAGALTRLDAALALTDDPDVRIQFERADIAQRLGRDDEAAEGFEAIADSDADDAIAYPAKQRLAQIYSARRRAALQAGDAAKADAIKAAIDALAIKGGAENDIKVYLSWDTDRTDVDLWVVNPKGETVKYDNKRGKLGGALFHDVTNGYGPESYTARRAAPGVYTVRVNFFGTNRRRFSEARGEVVVVLHEGTAAEARHVLPYRMFAPKQTVTVARIHVKEGGEG